MSVLEKLPSHDGWSVERAVPLAAGVVVLGSLALGRTLSPKWRGLTAFAGANLVMYASVGWCPASLAFEGLGLPRRGVRR